MNKKKELRYLFQKYIDRKSKESSASSNGINPFYNHANYVSQGVINIREHFSGTIYFYEWSDVSSEPRRYYTIDGFTEYLKSCGIYLALWQKDVIKNLRYSYITCKKGSKDLIIRNTYAKIIEASQKGDTSLDISPSSDSNDGHSIGFESSRPFVNGEKEPYQVGITRPPHIKEVFEPQGRWEEGSWFG